VASVALAGPAGAVLERVGEPFYIDGTPGQSDAEEADVAIAPNGRALVVWRSGGLLTGDIHARLYDVDGSPLSSEITVNTVTAWSQITPAVAADGLGRFVVAWTDSESDGDAEGIVARVLDNDASFVTAAFNVNTTIAGQQRDPDVAAAADGSFVVVWGGAAAGSFSDIMAQRYDSTGTPVGSEIDISGATGWRPTVGSDASGNFTVAWDGFAGASLRRFDSSGTPLDVAVALGSDTRSSKVSTNATGTTAVAWAEGAQGTCLVLVRRHDSSGAAIGSDLVASSVSEADSCAPGEVAVADDGSVTVTWTHAFDDTVPLEPDLYERDGAQSGVFGQRWDSAGLADGPNLRINTTRAGDQYRDAMALDADANLLALWQGPYLLGQRFCLDSNPTCDRCTGFDDSLDLDADGVPDACDLCSNVFGEQTMVDRARVAAKMRAGYSSKQTSIQASGIFSVAGGFAALDPDVSGARIRVFAGDGALAADAELASGPYGGSGTAGWKANQAGNKWVWQNKVPSVEPGGFGPPTGVLKLVLQDAATVAAPETVRVKVKFRQDSDIGNIVIAAEDSVLDFVVRLGDQAAADGGRCGESSFLASECDYRESTHDRRVRCRR